MVLRRSKYSKSHRHQNIDALCFKESTSISCKYILKPRSSTQQYKKLIYFESKIYPIMSTKSDDTAPPSDGEDNVGVAEMKSVFSTEIVDGKSGKKKAYWTVAMETMGMATGKDGEGDLWLETVEEGVPMLRKYVMQKDQKLAEEQASAEKKLPFNSWWDLCLLEEFHVTQTTFVKAFLKWAIKDREDVVEGSEESKLIVNVSKARRRLDSYFEWMSENMAEDMAQNPLTLDSVLDVAKSWDCQSSVGKDDRYCWWFKIEDMDQKKIKEIPAQEHLRYIVWYSHLVMFDKSAQDNGVNLVQDLDKIGFWNCMTMIPLDLSAKMDRLTIGVLPVKMKAIYCFGCARWMHIMVGLMKPFMSKKMRQRFLLVTENDAPDPQLYCDEKFGRENIPDGFMKLKGGTPHNDMFKKFKKRAKKKEKRATEKASAVTVEE